MDKEKQHGWRARLEAAKRVQAAREARGETGRLSDAQLEAAIEAELERWQEQQPARNLDYWRKWKQRRSRRD